MSRNLVCSVSIFEALTTLLNPFTFGLLVRYAFLYHSSTIFAPSYWAPPAHSSICYYMCFFIHIIPTYQTCSRSVHPSYVLLHVYLFTCNTCVENKVLHVYLFTCNTCVENRVLHFITDYCYKNNMVSTVFR